MPYYQNNQQAKQPYDPEGRISFSKNAYKKEDRHPDVKGKFRLHGKDYTFGVYQKTGKNGVYYAGKITEAQQKPQDSGPATRIPSDDELAF